MKLKSDELRKTLYIVTSITDILYRDGISSSRFVNRLQGMKNLTTPHVDDYVGRCTFTGINRIGAELDKKLLVPFFLKWPSIQANLIIVFAAGAV